MSFHQWLRLWTPLRLIASVAKFGSVYRRLDQQAERRLESRPSIHFRNPTPRCSWLRMPVISRSQNNCSDDELLRCPKDSSIDESSLAVERPSFRSDSTLIEFFRVLRLFRRQVVPTPRPPPRP